MGNGGEELFVPAACYLDKEKRDPGLRSGMASLAR